MAKARPSKTKSRSSTKKAPASRKKTKVKLSWSEEGQILLEGIIKKAKSKQGAIFVMSQTGDVVLEAGNSKRVDKTSLGALASALRGVRGEMNAQLRTKADWAQFGHDREGFWVDYFGNWIIVGVRVPFSLQAWNVFRKHLKKNRSSGKGSSHTSEALAGLSEAAVDLALKS
jgi:hypothetical protein